MRRTFKWDKKYLYWGVTAFSVVACAILFYMALNYLGLVRDGLKTLLGILSPFIWGLVITWIIAPMTRTFEREMFSPLFGKIWKNNAERAKKMGRGFAILLGEIVLLAIITALVYLIVPQLYQSIETIVKSSDSYITTLTHWIEALLNDYPEIESYALELLGKANESLITWLQSTLLPELGSFVSSVTAGVYYALMGVYNLLIGIIASVYILSNLENFAAGSKRWLYSVLTVENAKKTLDGMKFINRTFVGFINGKLLDSAIIGLICYVCCSLLKMPYTLLVSVIVGVTNIIPFFGPFLGAIPSAFLILLVSPLQCLYFVLFILALQQLDGNVIGPKILGDKTGLSNIWVIVAILVSGSFFGFAGMFFGVPVFACVYSLTHFLVEVRLDQKGMPTDTESYEVDPPRGTEWEEIDEPVESSEES